MTLLVIDASVAVKWALQEHDSDKAVALQNLPLTAPDLLIVECANVFWRKTKRGEMSEPEARRATQLIATSGIVMHNAHVSIQAALHMACMLGHPVYDCLYLALAQQLGAIFVTADDALCNKLPPDFPVRTMRLRDS